MILFETPRIESEWRQVRLRPPLRMMALDASVQAENRWRWPLMLTCIYRTPEEDRALGGHGVHPLWRALDVRTRDRDPLVVADLAEHVNRLWIYDPTRPTYQVAIFEKDSPHGQHLHFQVHPNTTQRGAGELT